VKKLLLFHFCIAVSLSLFAQVDIQQEPEPSFPPQTVEMEEQEKVYSAVEQMPQFEGGNDALLTFISKNMVYPSLAKENEIQGSVFLSYIVRANGNLSDIKVMKGVYGGSELDREAIRVLKLTNGKWSPGKHNGKPVNVRMTLPVRFKLQ
jgi:protein TonB